MSALRVVVLVSPDTSDIYFANQLLKKLNVVGVFVEQQYQKRDLSVQERFYKLVKYAIAPWRLITRISDSKVINNVSPGIDDGDKVLATGIQRNVQRFIGRTLHNRNDGAFVRVTATSNRGEIEQPRLVVKAFAEKILTLLPQHWPEEQDPN